MASTDSRQTPDSHLHRRRSLQLDILRRHRPAELGLGESASHQHDSHVLAANTPKSRETQACLSGALNSARTLSALVVRPSDTSPRGRRSHLQTHGP